MIGPSETIVDSSRIDMLAGLSPCSILRMPPDFSAKDGVLLPIRTRIATHRRARCPGKWRIPRVLPFPLALSVEPDIFHAPAIVDAVDHDRQTPECGLPAGCGIVVEDDRPGTVELQPAIDLPHQLTAPLLIFLH